MKIGLKHRKTGLTIGLIESDQEQAQAFCAHAASVSWDVKIYDNTIELIQHLKEGDKPDLLVLEENASPLNAYQTFEYLHAELNLNIPMVISHDILEEKDRHEQNNLYFIQKKFTTDSIAKIQSIFASESPDEKKYSLEYLKSLSDGNMVFVEESLQIFTTSVERKLAEIEILLVQQEFKAIGEIAHNIKPSFEMIESENGKNICNILCYEAEPADVSHLVNDLKNEFGAIQREIALDFPKLTET